MILSPLLPEVPGFGAATVSLMRPPVVKVRVVVGGGYGVWGCVRPAARSSILDLNPPNQRLKRAF